MRALALAVLLSGCGLCSHREEPPPPAVYAAPAPAPLPQPPPTQRRGG